MKSIDVIYCTWKSKSKNPFGVVYDIQHNPLSKSLAKNMFNEIGRREATDTEKCEILASEPCKRYLGYWYDSLQKLIQDEKKYGIELSAEVIKKFSPPTNN